jgi:C-terminal processing protease CtpA/Prc
MLLVLASSFLAPSAAAADKPRNLGFEEGAAGTIPSGWFSPTKGYRAELSDLEAQQGKLCVRLFNEPDATSAAPFGNLMQAIDAMAYRGQTVRFKAAVRCKPAGSGDRAQLWLRVDRPNNQMGFFDNMDDRPILAPQWRYYEIVGDVAEDAVALNIGCMLIAKGEFWLDDASLEVVSAVTPPATEPPRPLEGRALENLVAFTKLLGYLRYFHPSDQAAAANWEDFAIRGVRTIESSKDATELATRLSELFAPLAPTAVIYPTASASRASARLEPPADAKELRLANWKHLGVGTGSPQSIYRSERLFKEYEPGKVPEGFADPAEPLRADLGGGVSCLVPMTVFAAAAGTLPQASEPVEPAATQPARRTSGNDRGTRLAAVALAWNIFQHFYPYFDVVQTDWNAALRDALTRAATDRDERAFLDTLRRLVAELHDGHGNVFHSSDNAVGSLPLVWDWIEERLVVTAVGPDAAPSGDGADELKVGDIVLTINDRPAAEALAEVEQYVSGATPQWRRHLGLRHLAMGVPGESATLRIERAGGNMCILKRSYLGLVEAAIEPRPEKISEVRPGITYVDIDRIDDQDFKAALPQLEKARGIVFDLRGYPSKLSTLVITHLIDTPVTCARWNVPIVRRPDRDGMEFWFSNWPVGPNKPKLRAKVAFITDGRAISYAETYLGIIEHYKLAEIVGGPTAGTNGNVNPLKLPGGYTVAFTGMKTLKHDGSQHHGIGIRPTVPVSRTVAGVRAGRDELLERAIEVVSPKP